MATFQKQHCWSILLRLFHWMFALSIVTLVVTGLYINGPWTNTMIEGSPGFPMAWMRYTHFIAGYVFSGAIIMLSSHCAPIDAMPIARLPRDSPLAPIEPRSTARIA